MKRILFSFLLLSSFTLASQDAPGIIEVTGYASTEVEPDFMDLQIVIEHEGDNAKEVQGFIMDKSGKILAYLNQHHAVTKTRTDRLLLYPRQNYQTGKTTYSARQVISFRIVKITEYDELMPGLLELGVNGISNATFGSSEIESLKTKLTQQALQLAREKAIMMAGTLGQEIGRAVFISDEMQSSSPHPLRAASDMKLSSSSPSVEGGTLEIGQRVRVHFQLL